MLKMKEKYFKTKYRPAGILLNVNTYLPTPWSRVLLEKLTGSAASQEIPLIFGTRKFLTLPTSARHLSLSRANSIQSPQLPPTSRRSILILSSHLRLGLPNDIFHISCKNSLRFLTLFGYEVCYLHENNIT